MSSTVTLKDIGKVLTPSPVTPAHQFPLPHLSRGLGRSTTAHLRGPLLPHRNDDSLRPGEGRQQTFQEAETLQSNRARLSLHPEALY